MKPVTIKRPTMKHLTMKHLTMKHVLAPLAAAMLLAATLQPARAGQTCEARAPGVHEVTQSTELALRVARRLDDSGARVVVLARAGQDLGRWGLSWSHLGFAYRDDSGPRPVWRVLHKLNSCGAATAALYRQGLGEFFMDDLHEYRAAYAVLAPQLQARLLPLLRDNARVAQLHEPAYNMVAYPWALTYQQSNQWAIETLAMAEDASIASRDRAQAWLRWKDYRPTTLRIGALTRLGARVSQAHVAFDDHPGEQRYADRIDTVTADSVFAWLERAGLAGAPQVLR